MSVTKKFAALGAAAAISATGLVAATGTSAHAAGLTKSVEYTCSDQMGVLNADSLPTTFTIPSTVAQGSALPVSSSVTFPQTVAAAIVQLAGTGPAAINGPLTGSIGFGSATAPLSLRFNQAPLSEANPTVTATGSAAITTGAVGSQSAVTLPSTFTATIDLPASIGGGTDKVSCTAAAGADLAAGSVTVTKAAVVTPPANAALQKAQAKLKADLAKLKAAKKALKKAKGHKKVVLKKKIAKLNKVIKADKKTIKSLS